MAVLGSRSTGTHSTSEQLGGITSTTEGLPLCTTLVHSHASSLLSSVIQPLVVWLKYELGGEGVVFTVNHRGCCVSQHVCSCSVWLPLLSIAACIAGIVLSFKTDHNVCDAVQNPALPLSFCVFIFYLCFVKCAPPQGDYGVQKQMWWPRFEMFWSVLSGDDCPQWGSVMMMAGWQCCDDVKQSLQQQFRSRTATQGCHSCQAYLVVRQPLTIDFLSFFIMFFKIYMYFNMH